MRIFIFLLLSRDICYRGSRHLPRGSSCHAPLYHFHHVCDSDTCHYLLVWTLNDQKKETLAKINFQHFPKKRKKIFFKSFFFFQVYTVTRIPSWWPAAATRHGHAHLGGTEPFPVRHTSVTVVTSFKSHWISSTRDTGCWAFFLLLFS